MYVQCKYNIVHTLECILPGPRTPAEAQFPTVSGDCGFGCKHLKHTDPL